MGGGEVGFLSSFFAHLGVKLLVFGVVAALDLSAGQRDGGRGGGGGLGKRHIPAPHYCLGLREAGACGFHPSSPHWRSGCFIGVPCREQRLIDPMGMVMVNR